MTVEVLGGFPPVRYADQSRAGLRFSDFQVLAVAEGAVPPMALSVQSQPLKCSRLLMSSPKIGTDETAVAQRSSQALVP